MNQRKTHGRGQTPAGQVTGRTTRGRPCSRSHRGQVSPWGPGVPCEPVHYLGALRQRQREEKQPFAPDSSRRESQRGAAARPPSPHPRPCPRSPSRPVPGGQRGQARRRRPRPRKHAASPAPAGDKAPRGVPGTGSAESQQAAGPGPAARAQNFI
ncbi:PREDICTED: translation initiation factor IF-2-like [Chinchilla lanigera]|uniref:translation initiation factor IF-2-like n=1 Tax=Chinchilla lanigera TaxID=34839 RepID=UPI00038EB7F5|nr:PREDICTED: translation initiation factor IF-2-like [Chinchilla lanigera]